MNSNTDKQIAINTSIITIIVNFILSIFKIFAGLLASSSAMISDGVHTISDVFSTIIVMISASISNKDSDENHPYGHERLESIAAMILALVLTITGLGIGYSGFWMIFNYKSITISIPGMLALAAAVISVIVKELMFWYTRAAAIKINSDVLKADAWHHRTDALSSVGSFIGILGARIGFPILDPIASVVICLLILKVSFDIFKEALTKLVDRACSRDTVEHMKTIVLSQRDVLFLNMIKTRMFGSKIYVDIEISADINLTFKDSHEIAENVHLAIENNFPTVKHCTVHVNPCEKLDKE